MKTRQTRSRLGSSDQRQLLPQHSEETLEYLEQCPPFIQLGIPNPEERFMQIPTQMQTQEQDCSQQQRHHTQLFSNRPSFGLIKKTLRKLA